MGTLRLLLALAVVINHSGGVGGYYMITGDRAVQVFFAISGFLMALVLDRKYAPTRAGAWDFYVNRGLRIYVPYYGVLVVSLAIGALCMGAFGVTPTFMQTWADHIGDMKLDAWLFALIVNATIIGQDLTLWLSYSQGHLYWTPHFADAPIVAHFLIVPQSWSMALELTFYAMAPWLLRRSLPVLAVLAGVIFVARFTTYAAGYEFDPLTYRFFPFELGTFLAGAIVYKLSTRFGWPSGKAWEWGALALAAALALGFQFLPVPMSVRFWTIFPFMIALFPILIRINTRSKLDRYLGDLSYPIYLVHWTVRAFVVFWIKPEESAYMSVPVIIGSLICAAALTHFVERPLDAYRQRRLGKTPAQGAPAPA